MFNLFEGLYKIFSTPGNAAGGDDDGNVADSAFLFPKTFKGIKSCSDLRLHNTLLPLL